MEFLIKYVPNYGKNRPVDVNNDEFGFKAIWLNGYRFDDSNIAQVSALAVASGFLDFKIDTASADLVAYIDSVSSELGGTLEIVSSVLDTKIDTVSGDLETKIDTVSSDLDLKIDTVSADLVAYIDTVSTDLGTTIENVSALLEAEIDSSNSDLTSQIETVSTYLDTKIDTVSAILTAEDVVINDRIDTVSGDVEILSTNLDTVSADLGEVSGKVSNILTDYPREEWFDDISGGQRILNAIELTWNPDPASVDIQIFRNQFKERQDVSGGLIHNFRKNSSTQIEFSYDLEEDDQICIRMERAYFE